MVLILKPEIDSRLAEIVDFIRKQGFHDIAVNGTATCLDVTTIGQGLKIIPQASVIIEIQLASNAFEEER